MIPEAAGAAAGVARSGAGRTPRDEPGSRNSLNKILSVRLSRTTTGTGEGLLREYRVGQTPRRDSSLPEHAKSNIQANKSYHDCRGQFDYCNPDVRGFCFHN